MKNYKINSLPPVQRIFTYQGAKYFFVKVDHLLMLYKIVDDVNIMRLTSFQEGDIEKALVSHFYDIFLLMDGDKPIFNKIEYVRNGECYKSKMCNFYWFVIKKGDKYSLVSYPEFVVQAGWEDKTNYELAEKLAQEGYTKSKVSNITFETI